jgi:4-hydroxy-tetrahydrodipicolinate synthase
MTATKTQASGAGTASLAMKGVLSPVLTPFRPDLSVHKELLTAQCQWLLNCNVGLAVFGTNSEGNSLSFAERADLVQYLVAQGIDPHRMMPGTGGCALPDVVSLTQACLRAGVKDVLVLPPFYYKGVSAGAKDSGGQWSNTASMIERFSARGFSVFAGSENFLMRTMRAGGAGCISATANVNPAAISSLCANWTDSDADAQQQRLDLVRSLFSALPMIPAMKTAVAQTTGKEDWKVVRPPLISLTAAQETQLLNSMKDAGFSMKIDYK